jgi:uncharacterized membrane protein
MILPAGGVQRCRWRSIWPCEILPLFRTANGSGCPVHYSRFAATLSAFGDYLEALMRTDPLNLPATAARLRRLAHDGQLSASALDRALVLAGHTPALPDWRRFVDILLLLLGAALSLSGVFFFFAYNWADMPRLAKFGLIEGAIVLAVGLAAYLGLGSLAGRVALLAAAVLVGVLQAVFGQIYQTGADSYLLFLTWALLIAGWVAIGGYAPLWLLLLALLNLSLGFYWTQVLGASDTVLYVALAVLNAVWLLAWELAQHRGIAWLSGRWMPRLVALAMIGLLVVATIRYIFASPFVSQRDTLLWLGPAAYLLATVLLLYFYYRVLHDLFMLAVAALGIIIVVTAAGLEITDFRFEGYLALSALVVIQTAVLVYALRVVARRWEATT